jgi:DNA polymerase-3 subunit gamma/tau
MGLALYRKYRSRSLDEIVGQEHVTTLLSRSLKSGRVAHAYLFTGPRGTGKTSIARIMAHEINKLEYTDESTHLDIIEIDAASNNGVDDIRELREKVQFAPSQAEKKIYIIDEVHMLSKAAFNALLKTLEEPPEHVVFILATTDVDKLPQTIISRTQRYTFHLASIENIIKNLKNIAKEENIVISDDALEIIAEHSEGSYRDSVSLLDQLSSVSPDNTEITQPMIEASLGLAPKKIIEELIEALKKRDFGTTIQTIQDLDVTGIQPKIVAEQLIHEIRKQASSSPRLLSLLEGLMEVNRSSIPGAKLLATLGLYAKPNEKKTLPATVHYPIKNTIERPLTKQQPRAVQPPVATRKVDEQSQEVSSDSLPSGDETNFDMEALLKHAKQNSIALSSVLTKCSTTQNEGRLTIYAKNEFYKKKLDTPKYRQQIQDILMITTNQTWDINIIPGAKPPSDSKVAAITAMMGGGEEVSADAL